MYEKAKLDTYFITKLEIDFITLFNLHKKTMANHQNFMKNADTLIIETDQINNIKEFFQKESPLKQKVLSLMLLNNKYLFDLSK